MAHRVQTVVISGPLLPTMLENELFIRFAAACGQRVVWLMYSADKVRMAELQLRCTSRGLSQVHFSPLATEPSERQLLHLNFRPDLWVSCGGSSFGPARTLGIQCNPFQPPPDLADTRRLADAAQAQPSRVAVLGPESVGKTTLCRELARHFQTVWVPEYARTYAEAKPTPLEVSDVEPIARGNLAMGEALMPLARERIFFDTDSLMTALYGETYYNHQVAWLNTLTEQQGSDLYLLLAPDVPWVKDPQRDLPHLRQQFFERCLDALSKQHRRVRVIEGEWSVRWQAACQAIAELGVGYD